MDNEILLTWFLQSLSKDVYIGVLIFCRVGAALFLLPGFGEIMLSMRVRLMAALALTVILYASLPSLTMQIMLPASVGGMFYDIAIEIFVGTLFGLWARFLYTALLIMASYVAQMIGMANIFDSTLEAAGAPALASLVGMGGITLMFVMNGHHLLIEGLLGSFTLFPIHQWPSLQESALSIVEMGQKSLFLALQLATPFAIISFLLNLGLGFINRTMPQIMVFFVGQPLIVLSGFALMAIILPGSLWVWYQQFTKTMVMI